MPLQIVSCDITKMKVDAIVNAANNLLAGGGGVDGCIHRAAGGELLEECRRLGGCDTGDAKITKAYRLPCKYVIHTVGPKYKDGNHNEESLLRSCYSTSLMLAKENKCDTVAFPLISAGIYGYPTDKALRIATDEISKFLHSNEMIVYITIFERKLYKIDEGLYNDIVNYIDDNYVYEQLALYAEGAGTEWKSEKNECCTSKEVSRCRCLEEDSLKSSLEDVIGQLDESFTQMLLRKIDESGMKDSECYKKANIDRKLFSKIRSDINYKPSKVTALAFAIALELSVEETKELLMKAGYALSRSNKFDLIIEYFISNGIYNIFEINEALFAFDQSLLGT